MAEADRILLVEDDVLIGMMLVDMFDALGLPRGRDPGLRAVPDLRADRRSRQKPYPALR